MPNASITVYFNDKDYLKYLKKKEQINAKARKFVKQQIEEE